MGIRWSIEIKIKSPKKEEVKSQSIPQNAVAEGKKWYIGRVFQNGVKWFKNLFTPNINRSNVQPILPPIPSQPTETQETPLQPIPLQAPQQPIQPVPSPRHFHDNWIQNLPNALPFNAVIAGHDIDGKIMYVGRVFHNGDYIPAKAFNTVNWASFPSKGFEHFRVNFEYLVGDKYKWVPGRPFPAGAVTVNSLSRNEHLYVGRCYYRNSLTCGKFLRSRNCLYIPFGLFQVRINEDFEILVHEDGY